MKIGNLNIYHQFQGFAQGILLLPHFEKNGILKILVDLFSRKLFQKLLQVFKILFARKGIMGINEYLQV